MDIRLEDRLATLTEDFDWDSANKRLRDVISRNQSKRDVVFFTVIPIPVGCLFMFASIWDYVKNGNNGVAGSAIFLGIFCLIWYACIWLFLKQLRYIRSAKIVTIGIVVDIETYRDMRGRTSRSIRACYKDRGLWKDCTSSDTNKLYDVGDLVQLVYYPKSKVMLLCEMDKGITWSSFDQNGICG